jgi:ATP synthase subunit 6
MFGSLKSVTHIIIRNKLEKLILWLFLFVCLSIKNTLVVKKHSFILPGYTTFLFLFFGNIIGMTPYSISLTSHYIVTLFFSLGFFIGTHLIGLCLHKEKYFSLFLPEGVPIPIIPFLICVEYISCISRVFSLSIRLFANTMSGHILLKILSSFAWVLITTKAVNCFWLVMPAAIIAVVVSLEILIAFLQAYVFIMLFAIYLDDAIKKH